MITPWEHQIEIAPRVVELVREHHICYLAMEERTGKSITFLLAAEQMEWVKTVLIITKKKALGTPEHPGWTELLRDAKACGLIKKDYDLVNYHQAKKLTNRYDLVLLDESHSYISGYPKTSLMYKDIAKLVYGADIVYASATPYAQGPQLLYHQFKLSKWSPWKEYRNYYEWFNHFCVRVNGSPKMVRISGNQLAVDYSAVDHAAVMETVKHLFITKTRAELGFEQEPEDVLHWIELSPKCKAIYNHLMKHQVLEFTHDRTGKDYMLVCDTPIKLRWALHMLEGGVLKIDNEYLDLGFDEKAQYIMDTWGDSKDLVIMYHYQADEVKLRRMFKNAWILQATSYAEGIDLSGFKHLVIYSQDFSTAKHSQRRARQANKNRTEEIKVHFLLVKKAVSHQVYKTVSINKTNFIDSLFEREYL